MGSDKMSRPNIPSEEDFARATAAMKNDDRGLSDVRQRILERFRDVGVHECFVLYSRPTDTFIAYVFYLSERDISEGAQSGRWAEIREAVYDELAAVGRGNRDKLNVTVEFDSHENVEKNYEGDYFNRLR